MGYYQVLLDAVHVASQMSLVQISEEKNVLFYFEFLKIFL